MPAVLTSNFTRQVRYDVSTAGTGVTPVGPGHDILLTFRLCCWHCWHLRDPFTATMAMALASVHLHTLHSIFTVSPALQRCGED